MGLILKNAVDQPAQGAVAAGVALEPDGEAIIVAEDQVQFVVADSCIHMHGQIRCAVVAMGAAVGNGDARQLEQDIIQGGGHLAGAAAGALGRAARA